MQRYGQVIRLQPGALDKYKQYHAQVWPDVLKGIRRCHIRNYSIFHQDGILFAYLEYTGRYFQADMTRMAADPKIQEWWAIMKPLQDPLPTRAEGEWWSTMDEVFHTD